MANKRLPPDHPLRLPAGVKLVNGRPVFGGYTPAAQHPIPAGLYDPVLDATLGQAGRGFNDLVQSTATQATRLQTDYGLGRDAIDRSQTRGNEDLATSTANENTAYGQATQNLTRQYGQLADSQRQQQNAYGVLGGGAAMQAAAKRAANQAHDQAPMDTAHGQQLAAIQTASTRLGENSDLARGNLALTSAPPDAANPLGGRQFQDLGTQLSIAARELGATGIDTNRSKAYAAAQMGYVPPASPGNERTNPLTGKTTRSYNIGGIDYVVDPSGRIVARRRPGGITRGQ